MKYYFDGESLGDIGGDFTFTTEAGTWPAAGRSGKRRLAERASQNVDREVTVVDEETGGAKGRKLARHELLPPESLTAIAERFGLGAAKYEDRNWEKGYDWSLSYGALQRHLLAWWGGEDVDEEFGDSHLAAAGFHVLVLLSFIENHLDGDDRPVTKGKS